MIAGISNQADIDVYLASDEIERLEVEPIEGRLVYYQNPKYQGKLVIEKNEEFKRKFRGHSGVGIDDRGYWNNRQGDFVVLAYLDEETYTQISSGETRFRDNSLLGVRTNMKDGSKFRIYDIKDLGGIERVNIENLEDYVKNRKLL
jgi:hypothetical protein